MIPLVLQGDFLLISDLHFLLLLPPLYTILLQNITERMA